MAVIGSALGLPGSDESRSLEELLHAVTQDALADAGLKIEDIDGIVVAANDQFDGRAISIMAASGSVGGVDRDILSTPSAGEHAFVLGALRIASGQYETQLVLAWSPTEASSLSEAQRLGADPYFHRHLPLDEASSFALQASALTARSPEAPDLAERIAMTNRQNGQRAYKASAAPPIDRESLASSRAKRWPLNESMLAEPVTGVVALVLASEDYVKDKNLTHAAFVSGMGWSTEAGFLGDRDLAQAPALEEAARLAYEMAAISAPREAFDVIELSDASPYQQLIAYEALGLSRPDQWKTDVIDGAFGPESRSPVNLSGGISSVNPVFCTGLMRIAEAARQVMGRAGEHQKPGVDRALAHAASGFAMMYQTVVVLDKNKGAAA
jgi:acetyl-CoA C-acetyltransferase